MAKLNGVKTVDMANGEVTKVSYDGAEYVKVDGVAQVGDIFFETSGNDRVSEGVYYQVVGLDNVNDPEFIDDTGETNAIDQDVPPYNLYYRKVSAKPSELQVGDTVKVSIPDGERPAYGWGGVENGDIGKVISINGGEARVEFTTQKRWSGRLTELVKVAEDGYVRVTDRDPKVGDYVKFTEGSYDVTAGSYYEVTAIDEDGDAEFIDDAGDENSAVVDYETFEVYEKAGVVKAETLNAENTALRVGDYAKVIQVGHRLNGKIVELKHRDIIRDPDLKFFGEPVDGSWRDAFAEYHIVKATDAEVASAMKEIAEAKRKLAPKFSVGDYVKIVKSTRGLEGKIAKIIDVNVQSFDYEIVHIPKVNNRNYVANADMLVKATEEEAAEAKLAEQFAKIGRKPNEFKKGDVVRAKWIFGKGDVGQFAEIYSGPRGNISGGNYDLNGGDCQTLGKHIELIAPVESRVDRL